MAVVITAPRIHGSLLRSVARLARTRPGANALLHALRAELRISELSDLPATARGGVPMDNRPVAGRPPRQGDDAKLGVPSRTSWSRCSADFVTAYEKHRSTPEQVTGRVLDATRALESQTPSMAVLSEYAEDSAVSEAEASGDRYRVGAPKGPLDGVCVVIKEQMDVRGFPTRSGTSFIQEPLADQDATVVRRLREAGAIVVGLSNMTEYGMTPAGFNPHRKMPRNPHHPGHIAGGSSTGSGVAVATGLVPFAIGADGGGSIRIPSALNGVFGIKPTWGRVSRAGDPGGGTVAHLGPLASSTLDLAHVLEIVGNPDPLDAETANAPALARGSLVRALGRGVKGLRIGVDPDEWAEASTAVQGAGREALKALEREGAVLVDVSETLLRHAPAMGYLAIGLECRALLRAEWEAHADAFTPDLQVSMSVLAEISALEYLDAQRLRVGLRNAVARLFRDVDLLALPTTVETASPVTDAQFESGFLDAQTIGKLCRFNFMGNLTGLPAASVPVGVDTGGLPIGLQLVGDAWDEATVLAAAAHLERLGVATCARPKIAVDVL